MANAAVNTIWSALSSLAEKAGEVDAILAPARAPLRFGGLVARVAEIRATLARFGVGRGDRVLTALPHGADTAVCYFGVASCATYVPLNPDYTEQEFARYLARIRPKAVIVPNEGATAIRRAARGISIIEMHSHPTAPVGSFTLQSTASAQPVEPEWADADDVALILLTSGTTAQPKLVPMKQRHLTALAHAGKRFYDLGPRDRYLHTAPMFHGHGLKSGLTVPVLAGSAVICAGHFDVRSFFEMLDAFRPTWFSASYTVHQAILDGIDDHREIARDAKVRFIMTGSGPTSAGVMRGLETAFGAPVLNRYSMSETGALTCMPPPPRIRKPGTVGVPLLNEVRVMDERGNFVSANAQGEIVTRGPSVFDGYLDDPDANASAFVNGWFCTGDLGSMDELGNLTITGRIKEQVINQGGEKVAVTEVERVIADHPAVAHVCVFGVPHPTLGEVVAAAVVPREGMLSTEGSIIEFAQSRLAAFKVPRCVLFTTAIPLGATQKVDRLALARQCALLVQPAASNVALQHGRASVVEREVARLWEELLQVRDVARDMDFFLAGGDSLKAAELSLAVRQRFGVDVSMRDLMRRGATVRGLAHLIEQGPVITLPARLVPIKADGDRPPLFAIPGSDGNPGSFIHFGRSIDPRQPLYGLVSRGFDGSEMPLDRMEAIAADHLNAIRAFQPNGPYQLIGACFGGRVAYEMARQLVAAGERVDFLCLLDPSPPFTNSRGLPRLPVRIGSSRSQLARFVTRRFRMYAGEFMDLNWRQRPAFVSAKLAVLREIILRRDPFRGDRSEVHAVALHEANQVAGCRYVPEPYDGPVIMALTEGRVASGVRNYRLDWLQLMPHCRPLQYVPGRDTGDMLIPPNVQVLADRVNAWLLNASTRAIAESSFLGLSAAA